MILFSHSMNIMYESKDNFIGISKMVYKICVASMIDVGIDKYIYTVLSLDLSIVHLPYLILYYNHYF